MKKDLEKYIQKVNDHYKFPLRISITIEPDEDATKPKKKDKKEDPKAKDETEDTSEGEEEEDEE